MQKINMFYQGVLMVIVIFKLIPVSVTGQSPEAIAEFGSPADTSLKTSWGDPDLQGIWNNRVVTPLERPEEFGMREFMTSEEIATAEIGLLEYSQLPGRDNREGAGTEKGVRKGTDADF